MKNFYYLIKAIVIITIIIFFVKGYNHFFNPDVKTLGLGDIKLELDQSVKTKIKQAENFILDDNDTTIIVSDDLMQKILEENEAYAEDKARTNAIVEDLEKSQMTVSETKEFIEESKDLTDEDLQRLVLEENARYLEKIKRGEVSGLDTSGNPIYVPGSKERQEELEKLDLDNE